MSSTSAEFAWSLPNACAPFYRPESMMCCYPCWSGYWRRNEPCLYPAFGFALVHQPDRFFVNALGGWVAGAEPQGVFRYLGRFAIAFQAVEIVRFNGPL